MIFAGRRGAVEACIVVLSKPVWKELFDGGGLNDGAREDVCADFAGFFEEKDTEVFVAGGGGELLETDRSGETSRA